MKDGKFLSYQQRFNVSMILVSLTPSPSPRPCCHHYTPFYAHLNVSAVSYSNIHFRKVGRRLVLPVSSFPVVYECHNVWPDPSSHHRFWQFEHIPPPPHPQHTNTHIPKQITKIFNSTLVGGLKQTQKLMALWQKYLTLVLQFSSTKVWKYINILKWTFSIWYTSLIWHAPGQISLDPLGKNAHTKAVHTR